MTGQIPSYGQHFALEPIAEYDPARAQRRYVLKADAAYWIRSDKTSKAWALYYQGTAFAQRTSLSEAMRVMRILVAG